MPTYTYRCSKCGAHIHTSETFEEHEWVRQGHKSYFCPTSACSGDMEQVLSFAFHRSSIEPHFNHSLGTAVTSDRQARDLLRVQSEEATARTGIEHNYELVDPRDPAAAGVTEKGLEATEKRKRDTGQTEATKKIVV